MSKLKLSFVFLVFPLLASSLSAGIYLRAGLLYNTMDDVEIKGVSDFASGIDDSVGFTAAVGYKFSYLRFEGELNYFDTDIGATSFDALLTSGSLERTSVFANLLLEIPGTPFFEPYVGAGVGISQLNFDFTSALNPFVDSNESAFSSSADESLFSFQFMAGIRISLRETISVYAGYRYLVLESVTVSEGAYSLSPAGGNHIFEVGVGLGF